VLGGRGATGAHPADKATTTFANNDGWHDDVSDGPVRATVAIGDRTFEAEPGYVVVTPPNFAPGLFGVLTMDDVAREAFYSAGYCTPPVRPSFANDIWPAFDRLTGNQWVNHGVFLLHGRGSPLDARDPTVVTRLADASDAARPFREAVFKLFRERETYVYTPAALPSFYGDGVDYGFPPVPPAAFDASADLIQAAAEQKRNEQGGKRL
jgi:L-Lysine epsilon oxidase N-terminal